MTFPVLNQIQEKEPQFAPRRREAQISADIDYSGGPGTVMCRFPKR